jgi:hypothetical protein
MAAAVCCCCYYYYYHHHHRFDQLEAFSPEHLHDPRSLISRVRRRLRRNGESPFPWIRIRVGQR